MNASPSPSALAALFLAAGLSLGGYFIGKGISNRDAGSRVISVKGLSEREEPASIAIWTLGYNVTGNDLPEINTKLAGSTKAVMTYLKTAGFDDAELSQQPPSIRDLSLQERDKDAQPLPYRYTASQSVLLRTNKVDKVKPAVAGTSALMDSGVMLNSGNQPKYIFDRLNEVKPGMIEEATKNARVAGEQFARDSNIKLGRLRDASQGWFQVEDRDEATPERKVVRVVVEVRFEIE